MNGSVPTTLLPPAKLTLLTPPRVLHISLTCNILLPSRQNGKGRSLGPLWAVSTSPGLEPSIKSFTQGTINSLVIVNNVMTFTRKEKGRSPKVDWNSYIVIARNNMINYMNTFAFTCFLWHTNRQSVTGRVNVVIITKQVPTWQSISLPSRGTPRPVR